MPDLTGDEEVVFKELFHSHLGKGFWNGKLIVHDPIVAKSKLKEN